MCRAEFIAGEFYWASYSQLYCQPLLWLLRFPRVSGSPFIYHRMLLLSFLLLFIRGSSQSSSPYTMNNQNYLIVYNDDATYIFIIVVLPLTSKSTNRRWVNLTPHVISQTLMNKFLPTRWIMVYASILSIDLITSSVYANIITSLYHKQPSVN